ncbi:unnamed protein product, partial [Vitis vinifera]|uniref:Uncharacterized protein n=1 Tax=Vitis vinifera TaxID=29760 RepID=D7UBJ8_VITVI
MFSPFNLRRPSPWCNLQCLDFQQLVASLKISLDLSLSHLKIFFFSSLLSRTMQLTPLLSLSITLPIIPRRAEYISQLLLKK